MNSLNIQVKTPWQKEKQTVKLTAAQAGKTLQQQTNKERVLEKFSVTPGAITPETNRLI